MTDGFSNSTIVLLCCAA